MSFSSEDPRDWTAVDLAAALAACLEAARRPGQRQSYDLFVMVNDAHRLAVSLARPDAPRDATPGAHSDARGLSTAPDQPAPDPWKHAHPLTPRPRYDPMADGYRANLPEQAESDEHPGLTSRAAALHRAAVEAVVRRFDTCTKRVPNWSPSTDERIDILCGKPVVRGTAKCEDHS